MIKLSLPRFWSKRGVISYLMFPFSLVYLLIIKLRRFYYTHMSASKLPLPVIVVGNITVGGTGKTPLVIYLARLLKKHGYTPGVISRGYGRKNKSGSIVVSSQHDSDEVGDEALLIFRRANCLVVVNVDREAAARKLMLDYNCDVVISDDGLQHYNLSRYIEIAVVDAEFNFGNEFCLPAGPLREPVSRLHEVDFIIKNFNASSESKDLSQGEYRMAVEPIAIRSVNDPANIKSPDYFKGEVIHAVAAIGRPRKFFQTLKQLNLTVIEHVFPDHHVFRPVDFSFEDKVVIMTEKDAVKCDKMANENFWYVEVGAKLSGEFTEKLLGKLNQYYN